MLSMNIDLHAAVTRVPYPVVRAGFSQTYEHVLPSTIQYVVGIDEEREAITVRYFHESEWHEGEFWAGNFLKVIAEPILQRTD